VYVCWGSKDESWSEATGHACLMLGGVLSRKVRQAMGRDWPRPRGNGEAVEHQKTGQVAPPVCPLCTLCARGRDGQQGVHVSSHSCS